MIHSKELLWKVIRKDDFLINKLRNGKRTQIQLRNTAQGLLKNILDLLVLSLPIKVWKETQSYDRKRQKLLVLINKGNTKSSDWVHYDFFHFYKSFEIFLADSRDSELLPPWLLDKCHGFFSSYKFLRLVTARQPEIIIISSWNPESRLLSSPSAKVLRRMRRSLGTECKIVVLGWDTVGTTFWYQHLSFDFIDEIIALENPNMSDFLVGGLDNPNHITIESLIPLPMNPSFVNYPIVSPRSTDLFFFGQVGSYRDYRHPYLEALNLLDCKSIISANGSGTSSYSYSEMFEIMSRSKIGINFSESVNGVSQLKGRVWETMLSGALLLEQENSQILKFFEPNKHFVFFDSPDSLIEKVTYFLANKEERLMIAKNGQERARQLQKENSLFRKLTSLQALKGETSLD